MEYENNEEMPDLAVLGTITIEVAGGSYNGTSAVGTRVKQSSCSAMSSGSRS